MATSPELASARQDLEASLSTLAEDLADLVESVRAVESDPARFGLDAAEVSRRKRLVQEAGGEVEDMREELGKTTRSGAAVPTGAGAAGAGGGRSGGREDGDLPHPNAFAIPEGGAGEEEDEDAYAEFEQQQQVRMMREQDQHLDGVFLTVGNLRMQAEDMGRELEEQREMLEVVDSVADRVGGRLQTGVEKLRHVMRRNEDRLSSCCIAVLIVVLIILLVLLLVL
jgi:hypothetical protein